MIDRRTLLAGTGAVFLAAPRASLAQSERKVPKIGLITLGAPGTPWRPAAPGPFWDRLRELGWVEGQTIVVERRGAGGDWRQIGSLAAELARLKVDVILVPTGGEARRAHEGTDTIPICAIAGDLQAEGLVANLAKPEGNVTGVQVVQADLIGKRLAFLKEVVPGLRRVGVVLAGGSATINKILHAAEESARSLRLELHVENTSRPEDFERAFSSLKRKSVRAMVVVNTPDLASNMTHFLALAARSRIVSMYELRFWAEGGGLMSYGPMRSEYDLRWAECVDKILRGTKPADIPVQQPTKYELVINLKTAKALGLTIPPSLLGRADEVIQ